MVGYTTKILIFALDVVFALFAFYFSILLAHNFNIEYTREFFSWATPILVGLRIAASIWFGTHSIVIRYIGEKDYKHVFYSVSFASLAFLILVFQVPGLLESNNRLAIVLIDFFVMMLLSGGLRVLLRLAYDQMKIPKRSRLNTVIFGAGEMGVLVEHVLRHHSSHNYRVSAFFDDNPKLRRKKLNGIKIYNPKVAFDLVIRKYDIKVAIIGINNLTEKRRVEFINACLAHQVKVLKVPSPKYWINGKLKIGQLTDINLEDLLNRPPIRLDEDIIRESIRGKTVMVTGCAGSIGSEIVRQLLRFSPYKIVGLDQAETPLAQITLSLKEHVTEGVFQTLICDVRDQDKLHRIFREYRPDYVFHAAAYKHVPVMEDHPDEAIKTNVLGTKNMADLSAQFNVKKFVLISTDKVVNPANVMGASKRIAEIYTQSYNFVPGNGTQFITTRFGNVLGSNGSVVPIFKAQIERQQPVTVTHPDIVRFFMTIPEACQLVLEAGCLGRGGEIFVFDMGKPVRILDMAKKMIQMAGLTPGRDIEIKFTGLRPGEKIYEELLADGEGLIPTHHPKIKKAAVKPCNFFKVSKQVSTIIDKVYDGAPSEELVAQMKVIVPEFASRNSIFSALDKSKTA